METVTIEFAPTFLELHLQEIQFIVVFGGMLFLLLMEEVLGRDTREIQVNRWLSNISLTLLNHFIIIFYSIFVISILAKFSPESPLLKHFSITDIPSFFVILVLMEFISYWIHRFYHKVPLFWRIHKVHHTDTELDVTTSHRHHPFEPMLNILFFTPIVLVMGAPFIVMVTYSLLQTAFSLFSHSNISLPEKVDKTLRLFVVTPNFHRMHHSSDQHFTDSNYSAIVPWFDYLFGTATQKPYKELAEMEIGLETLREPKASRIDMLLATPFFFEKDKV